MANTFEGNRLIHVPVTITPDDIKIKYPSSAASSGRSKQCSWWSDNPLLPYNAMLVSAYFGMDKIKDRSEIRDDVLFLGDSGGFQILQNKLDPTKCTGVSEKLTPEKVIKWQMKVCDIGMTLDIPTPRAWIQVDDKNLFEDRLKESKKNALTMLEYKDKHIDEAYNPDFKLFNCIHGVYLDQMEHWYNETTENQNYEYDGFSLSTSKVMKYLIALRLGFAIEYSKGKPFHLLGVSSPSSLTLIAYANKYTDTQIYFDSSSAATGRMLRKYMLFWNLTGNGITLSGDPKYGNHYTLECPCPICTQLERPEDLWELKTTSGILLTLHNLFWIANHTAFINNLVHYEDELIAYVKWLTREPPDNPYQPPEKIEKYVAGAALEQGDMYNNEMYNICNDLNLPDLVKNGTIPLTAPVLAREELLREWNKMYVRSEYSSWVLQYMGFLDSVKESGLETAWNKHFKRHESNASFEFDESNPENKDFYRLKAEQNSRIRDLLKDSEFKGTKAYRNEMKKEMLNPHTQEKAKVKEIVEEALTEVSISSRNNKSKNKSIKVSSHSPTVSNKLFD